MKYFPVICVDNFFETPYRVRSFALQQEYETSSNMYAGVRSKEIAEIDQQLFDLLCHKIVSLFMDPDDVTNLKMSARFQKIPRISDQYPELNQGWVHDDGENIFAGVIYLNPEPNPDSGTSLYNLKPDETAIDIELSEIKRSLNDGTLVDKQQAVDAIKKHNSKYVETARFNNVFNRVVAYDASVFHKANSYDNDEERLTLVFFLTEISGKNIPLMRMRDFQI